MTFVAACFLGDNALVELHRLEGDRYRISLSVGGWKDRLAVEGTGRSESFALFHAWSVAGPQRLLSGPGAA